MKLIECLLSFFQVKQLCVFQCICELTQSEDHELKTLTADPAAAHSRFEHCVLLDYSFVVVQRN